MLYSHRHNRDFGNWQLPYKYGTYPALNVQFVQCMVGIMPLYLGVDF